jgi:hypothetical protein
MASASGANGKVAVISNCREDHISWGPSFSKGAKKGLAAFQ